MKRLVVISDLHCGHKFGICPPQYQSKDKDGNIQQKFWDWYCRKAKSLGRIDLLVMNGDAIDGEQARGSELVTTDRGIQVGMAEEAIRIFDAARVEIVCGTPYHGGKAEDFEQLLAQRFDGEGHDEWFCDIGGMIFNFKHKGSVSRNWASMASGVLREQLQNMLTSLLNGQVKVDIVVRSHAHRFVHVGNPAGYGYVTPSLQLDSSYGRRMCSGKPDIGFLSFDIHDKEKWEWKAHLMNAPLVAPSVSII